MGFSLIFISLSLGLVNCYSENSNHKYCDDLSPSFGDINLDQIAGVWYGIEKIPHLKRDSYKIERTEECFYIDIKEKYIEPTPPTPYGYGERDMSLVNYNSPSYMLTTSPYVSRAFGLPEQYRIRHFVLEWHEGLWQDDFHIKVNTSHKGFWPTDVPNGSVDNMYRFFGGVIQVLKVANTHLVLNFCMRLPQSQLYSVVLARNPNHLTTEDLANIHNVFTLKHLSMSALQRVCYNSAVAINGPSSVVLLVLWLLLLRSRD